MNCTVCVPLSIFSFLECDIVVWLPIHPLITAQHNERIHHQVVLSVPLLPEQLS